ncbi:YbaB/EbfC family DNA-binding protein [Saccharomonospora piscinae]|uniref:YbaB/EbfC family nucleoid-associated protein n=1 Tax=Saccharomonospora piscinae TaxID=687388 RepID=UPI0011060508|nr:YbaB/EbfC family nucleoid-associated protein [Saccharomonospora piscinae]TLW90583.1 YbaB/EbfC family DNA-binding protein [Saccharomonospora piscinae]
METDADRDAARIGDQVRQTSDRAARQFSRLGGVAGKAESGDGAIRVEVAPGGLLTDVRLTHAALRSGTDALAQQIMTLADTARRRAGDRMYRALSPVLGPDGDATLASLGYEPLPDTDVDDEGYSPVLGGR